MTVRAATKQDMQEIVRLYREGRWATDRYVHPSYAKATYHDDQFYRDFEAKLTKRIAVGNQVFVVQDGDKLAGFAIVADADEYPKHITNDFNKAAELHQLYIDVAYQGKGYGKILFDACRDRAVKDNKDEMLINVLGSDTAQNEKALVFYQNQGAELRDTVVEQKERSGKVYELHCPVLSLNLKK